MEQTDNLANEVENRSNIPAIQPNSNSNFLLKSNIDLVELGQNRPNPAKVYTTIPVNIPQNIQAAYLDVTDTQGKLVKRVVIEERGASSIQLRFDLAAGLYFYTLVTDGEIIDTKRMMLTK